MSFTDTEQVIRKIEDEVKLALAKAIAKAAEEATNEEQCEGVRDLTQAFLFLPVMGDLPDFVHSHGGVAVTPTGTGTTPPVGGHTHGTPAPTASSSTAPTTTGSHAHAAGIADMPSAAEGQLDALLEAAGVDDAAGGAGPIPGMDSGTTTPAPTPVTPQQMRLEQAVEDARIALMDALAKAAKQPIEKSACLVLLAEAFNLLPGPMTTPTTAATPPPVQAHGTPQPAPAPVAHSHGM